MASLTAPVQASAKPFQASLKRFAPLPAHRSVAAWQPVTLRSRCVVRAETEEKAGIIENPDSELSRKKAEAERLRAAEKFMVIGSGTATCKGCGYEYQPEKGDPEFPVPRGTLFQNLPEDYVCPVCGAPKDRFESRMKVVAGFAENQKYGLGTNSMTGDQKTLLIYGALFTFFLLFLAGYALE
mmetsp:Transcript_31872/g.70817  ORF Transcript_31872/g.70817 Transcript_31872/m.70817 type:complete len:183 (+) Transcript_31872:122-670(+)|eukprot:CAMPEP_0202900430 /NCGR_PEP_ID=MMETSP1392-20130828/11627_1 /ASSEMBLY_ACC=CAM_ASM_000868 /TAXON_ID=225041 /ORGANISM="Chlamydomonas chlamydogama, Strain SAG 11-48b" /LENGTH=182 /DNA_ID=CAMNT_0049586813 /DNA_START=121 /DNA_END=669 /DNA_ORIENTATION=+